MPKIKLNFYLITYKLLGDLLFFALLFFGIALLIEGLIPGLISEKISFLKLILFLGLNIFAMSGVAFLGNFSYSSEKENKKTVFFLAVFSFFYILNGLLKINFYLSLIFTAISLVAIYFIYKNIFNKK